MGNGSRLERRWEMVEVGAEEEPLRATGQSDGKGCGHAISTHQNYQNG